ncbi:MAG TPA: FtsX-like permease family protein [Gemmatimonadaceae bacterium]|nr:FtsX-like permease family protein [Gemmatimonadaceae bacterium]
MPRPPPPAPRGPRPRRPWPSALTRKLLRDLWRLRGQVASIAAVVACGVMIVVAMYGTLRSVEREVGEFYTRYRFADVFASATRVPAPVARRIAAIPGVSVVETRAVLTVSLDVPGLALPAGGRLVSVPDDGAPMLDGVHLRAGRMVRPRSTDEVVVSAGFAAANGIAIGDSLGAVLDGRWKRLHVVGLGMAPEFVWELSAAGSYTADERAFGVLWMSRAAVEGAAGMRGAFNDVALRLAPGASRDAVLAEVDSVLAPYGGLGAVGRDRHPSHRVVEAEFRSLRVFGITIPLVFLAVAGFLINVVLARLVATQRGEIAALKAFGYTDREVGAHFLAFAAAAVVAGSAAGLALGAWLGGLYTGLYDAVLRLPELRFTLDPASAAASVAASLLAALAGAAAAVRATVRLPPAEALRPEAPERYRPLLLERLGLGELVSPAARMVLRHIERRPARAASTILGVALALGLLAGTMALFDAAFYMADVQFRRAQREDVSVTFNHARPAAAVRELARIPGVLVAEPVRSMPVRVRRGAVVRTVALSGVRQDAVLHRIVDQQGAVFHVPPAGAVLTTAFARQLGVARGDTIRLELLERGGEARDVEVAALADELFGATVYMEQGALSRLLDEAPRATGAFLRVDPRARAAVLARLKTIPAVAGAASREALIAAWDRQMLQSIRVSGTLVVTCAIVIALGAVYNGARIALSERGRELASLRVLGFHRREVAALLFGEQGALTLAALPLGVLLGVAFTTWLARAFVSEDQRFPVVLAARTYVGAVGVVLAAAVLAGLLMRRRLNRMDLIAVLKTRE